MFEYVDKLTDKVLPDNGEHAENICLSKRVFLLREGGFVGYGTLVSDGIDTIFIECEDAFSKTEEEREKIADAVAQRIRKRYSNKRISFFDIPTVRAEQNKKKFGIFFPVNTDVLVNAFNADPPHDWDDLQKLFYRTLGLSATTCDTDFSKAVFAHKGMCLYGWFPDESLSNTVRYFPGVRDVVVQADCLYDGVMAPIIYNASWKKGLVGPTAMIQYPGKLNELAELAGYDQAVYSLGERIRYDKFAELIKLIDKEKFMKMVAG